MKELNRCDPIPGRRWKTSRKEQNQPNSFNDTHLKFIHLRYFPPGLVLQYQDCQGKIREKVIDLLELNYASNIERFSNEIVKGEPLLFSTRSHRTALVDALVKLKDRCLHDYGTRFVKQYGFLAHGRPVTKMCLSKDGKCLVTTSTAENLCSVWDLGGRRETALLKGHTKPITAISLNHFADKVLTGSEDGTVRLWELSSSTTEPLSSRSNGGGSKPTDPSKNSIKQCQVKLAVTGGKIRCAEASADFSMAASGCSDCTAYVHDLANGVAMYRFGSGHTFDITSIQFDTWSTILLTASMDSNAALWDLRSGSLISMLEGHKSEIHQCLFDHSCQTVATCSADAKVRLWDVRMLGGVGGRVSSNTPPPSLHYEFTDNEDEVLSIHFDSRGTYLASGCKDGTLAVWNVKTGELQFKLDDAHDAAIRSVRWSPNGALLLTAGDDRTVNLFHPDMATCIQTLAHHKGAVTNACFSYSNEYLVTAGEDRNCILYRLHKPKKIIEPFTFPARKE